MKLTFLGTGTSQGVPVIGCRCPVCSSADPRDNRLRTSAMVETDDGVRIIIDAGPDFRQQMLRQNVSRTDAILLTHGHTDHIAGIDDVRAFNFVDYPAAIHTVHIYAAPHTTRVVLKNFDYAFEENRYRGVPVIELHTIDEEHPFEVKGVEIVPFKGLHSRFGITGYRIGGLVYMTDFKEIDDTETAKLQGAEVLVVNGLRPKPHDSHFCIGDALALAERIGPKRVFLTHLSHEAGLHADSASLLPPNVQFAYDGLEVAIGNDFTM